MSPDREVTSLKVISFSPVVPYAGVPYAGASYYFSHLTALALHHKVVVVAPATERNIRASERVPREWEILLIPLRAVGTVGKIVREVRPISAPLEMHNAISHDESVVRALRSADVVEFQWSEYSSLAADVARVNPTARRVAVVHDVLRQKHSRRMKSPGARRKIRAAIALSASAASEARRLRSVDEVIVFSEKDAELLRERVRRPISVVRPPLVVGGEQGERIPGRLLFTGAMDRPENDQAALWFLDNVWPSVTQAEPEVTFTIAGASPSPMVLERAAGDHRIRVTGYVDDLDRFYRESSLFVAPLMLGAGLKFKTVSAMLAGLPIVATPVAAEGAGDGSHYVAVTSEPAAFAEAVITAIKEPTSVVPTAERARNWAEAEFGLLSFRSDVLRIVTGIGEM